MASSDSEHGSPAAAASKSVDLDPIARSALRYTLSPREYELLHNYLISHVPAVEKRTPPPLRYEAIVKKSDDYNAAAVRASLRVAAGTFTALKTWELFMRIIGRGPTPSAAKDKRFWKSSNVRLSASLSFILLFHRLLHRFFSRLRASLSTDHARPFRRRNPRVANALTSKIAPGVGASLACFFLGVYPATQLRITIAIYTFTRSLEFVYNFLENKGWFVNRPWWFGSWLLMPAAYGQLFHAFIFDRDCFPAMYTNVLLNRGYIQREPHGYAAKRVWPKPTEIDDSLAEIARLNWPSFTSPILFPSSDTLPRSLSSVYPVTSPAHPAIKTLSCALMHPQDPSCLRTYLSFYIQAFPSIARFFTMFYGAMSLVFGYKSFLNTPTTAINNLAKKVLKMSVFITGLIGTSWASLCVMVHWLPRNVLSTRRFYLAGFISGLWAFLDRKAGRSNFLLVTRMSIDSFWKVGVKHGWWKGIKNGDLLLFATSLAVINAIYEQDPKAVSGGVIRKALSSLRGDGWVDRAAAASRQIPEEEDVGNTVETEEKTHTE